VNEEYVVGQRVVVVNNVAEEDMLAGRYLARDAD
jgi:hypothetical protein